MFNRCTLVIYKYTPCVKNTRILGTVLWHVMFGAFGSNKVANTINNY